MSRFEQTLEKLNNRPAFAVKVTDKVTGNALEINATGQILTQKYGSVNNFFEGLSSRGLTRIEITERTRNGSTYKAISEPYELTITPTGNNNHVQMQLFDPPKTSKPETMPAIVPTPVQPQAYTPAPALNGVHGLMAAYQQMDHPRVVAENSRLTAEVERLTKANWELEKKLLVIETTEGQSVAKTEANANLLGQLAPLLAPLAEKFLGAATAAPAGMTGANLSGIKQQVIPIISNANDDLVLYLGILAQNAGNNELINDFFQLLEKHNLIPKEDA